MFNENQMNVFLEIVKQGSFTKAAETLYISQPAISKQIQQLEHQFGAKLFDRVGKKAVLTEAGSILLDCFSNIEKNIKEAKFSIQKAEWDTFSIEYNLGTLECMKTDVFSGIFQGFIEQNPKCIINMEEGHFVALNDKLDRGDLDIIITLESALPNNKGIRTYKLFDSVLSAWISKKSKLLEKDFLTFHDLENEVFFMPLQGVNDPGLEKCKQICRDYGFELKKIKVTPNIHSALLSAQLNNGVVMLDNFVYFDPHAFVQIHIKKAYDKVVLAWKEGTVELFEKYLDNL